jgi:hypothetical protein
MKAVYVRLSEVEKQRLFLVAKRERRHPSDQAAVLLIKALGQESEEHAEQRVKQPTGAVA